MMAEDLESRLTWVGKIRNFVKRHYGLAALGIGMSILANGCLLVDKECNYDSQCSNDQVCINERCVDDPEFNYEDDIGENSVETKQQPSVCPNGEEAYYLDGDGDEWGSSSMWVCEKAQGFVKNNFDCDDNDPKSNIFDNYEDITADCLTDKTFDMHPLWSPKGDKIAFHRAIWSDYLMDEEGVYIVDVNSKSKIQVSKGMSLFSFFRWSDSGELLYIAEKKGLVYSDFFSVKSDGTNRIDLGNIVNYMLINLFSENDKLIIAIQSKEGEFIIKYADGNSIFSTNLPPVSGVYLSPDKSKYIIRTNEKDYEECKGNPLTSPPFNPKVSLHLFDRNKNEFTTITTEPFEVYYYDCHSQDNTGLFWFPDNRKIIYERGSEIFYITDTESGLSEQVMENVGGKIKGVSDDGNKIFLSHTGCNLFFINDKECLRFRYNYLHEMDWSPDSKQMVGSSGSECGYSLFTISVPCSTNANNYWWGQNSKF